MKENKNTIKLISPAKVNLFLAVGKKSGDFHPVLNVMHSLLLHDVLYMDYEKSDKLHVSIEFLENEDSNGELPDIKLEDNLIYKAIFELSKYVKNNAYDIKVYVEKNIPLQAGLAGGSSNAAAALVGAAKIFGIQSDNDAVLEAAKKIGSDIAFFLKGGCALYTGKGDVFDHRIQPVNREIILIKPYEPQGLSTADVYEKFDEMKLFSDLDSQFSSEHDHDHNCDCGHDHSMSLTAATKQLTCADSVPLFNNLTQAAYALKPELVEIKEFLSKNCDPDDVLLCGSGAATFAFVPEDADVEEICHHAKHHGFWAIPTQLANVKVRIVPNIAEM